MRIGRAVMGTLYVVAGLGHFVATRMYMGIMPDYLPAHRELVLLSGAAEIAGGLGVLVAADAGRPRGGWWCCWSR